MFLSSRSRTNVKTVDLKSRLFMFSTTLKLPSFCEMGFHTVAMKITNRLFFLYLSIRPQRFQGEVSRKLADVIPVGVSWVNVCLWLFCFLRVTQQRFSRGITSFRSSVAPFIGFFTVVPEYFSCSPLQTGLKPVPSVNVLTSCHLLSKCKLLIVA